MKIAALWLILCLLAMAPEPAAQNITVNNNLNFGNMFAGVPRTVSKGDAGAAAEEQTEFDVMMTSFGDSKLNVVKVVKNLTGATLMEAKKIVESAPVAIKEKVSKEEAEKVKAELEEAGAAVELK